MRHLYILKVALVTSSQTGKLESARNASSRNWLFPSVGFIRQKSKFLVWGQCKSMGQWPASGGGLPLSSSRAKWEKCPPGFFQLVCGKIWAGTNVFLTSQCWKAGQGPVNGRSLDGADVSKVAMCSGRRMKKKWEYRQVHTHTRGRKKKKENNQKTQNPNRLKTIGSLALCFCLPDGGLCSTTGVEPQALSVPFSSGGEFVTCSLWYQNGAACRAVPGS